MLVIVGLIVLLVAGIFAIVGVLSNAGAAHPLTDKFRVRLPPHGMMFLFGIVVGGAGLLGPPVARFQREMAFINRDHKLARILSSLTVRNPPGPVVVRQLPVKGQVSAIR
ncbi:MAG: hypothetical protein QOI90_1140, partial [Mycobacterium sp.]|nr:hypothetical protein [Mycobacterium sp.]